MSKYYVTMNDTFFSGWGKAEGKINKLVIECDSLDEMEIVMDNAKAREEMKSINYYVGKVPYWNKNRFLVQIKDKNDYPSWFKKGYFINENV